MESQPPLGGASFAAEFSVDVIGKLVIETASGWLQRLDDMMGIAGCGFGTYTRQYE